MFHVGQKVVCVDASDAGWRPDVAGLDELVAGQVYTVSHVGRRPDSRGVFGIRVKECRYHPRAPIDSGYRASRFRPLDEIKGGMQILRALLKQPKPRIKETA